MSEKRYNFIDLFAGCGGLTEGFYKENFQPLAHVEIDHNCCETLKWRMLHYGYDLEFTNNSVIETDITRDDINDVIENVVGQNKVDIIIGGPPCQAYSSAGRARDEHGMKKDPRNYLFENYVKVLNHFKPKMFVFENVTGLLTATINGHKIVEKVFEELGQEYNVRLDPKMIVLNTANYGVPQIRKRVIIIGVRKDININVEEVYTNIVKTHFSPDMPDNERGNLKHFVTVHDAIGDMPKIGSGEKRKIQKYTPQLDNDFRRWICYEGESSIQDNITHRHNSTDVERYMEMAKNKWTFYELLEKRPDLNHQKARQFNNSYAVQFWDMPARTVLAHLSKDGNQFIHPDYEQGRSISVREAARLQSFPDDFEFFGSMSAQFKQIGNAVPPLFANKIAKSVLSILKNYNL